MLIVLSGLPGAGKTTKAQQIIKKHKTAKILSFDVFQKEHQDKKPEEIMMNLIKLTGFYLSSGISVIIDACNKHEHDRIRWETVATAYGVNLNWIDLNVSVEECIKRDARRDHPVGRDRILQIARMS